MDAENRYCLGCRRTLGEISRWSQMSDAERANILAQLKDRRSQDAEVVND